MTTPETRLPHDLQARLDVILAKPVLHRAPTLAASIAALVRKAYEREPHPVLTEGETRGILDRFEQAYPAFAAFREQLAAGERKDTLPGLDEIRRLAAGEQKDGVP